MAPKALDKAVLAFDNKLALIMVPPAIYENGGLLDMQIDKASPVETHHSQWLSGRWL